MVAEKVFAVIAESTRRDILQALAQESKSVGQLVEQLAVAQPTVSKHLRVLREAGVVTMRAQGQKRYYCINAEPLMLISSWLDSLGAGISAPAELHASAPASEAPTSEVPTSEAPAPAPSDVEPASAPAPAHAEAVKAESAPAPSDVELVQEAPALAVEAADLPEAAEIGEHAPAAEPEADALEPLVTDVEAAFDPAEDHPAEDHAAEELLEKVPAAAVLPEAVTAAAQQSVAGTAITKPPLVPFAGGDASVQGQISRSVGRAAGRAVDLLSNLPAIPKLRRRKDQ